MAHPEQLQLERAEKYVKAGDFRRARQTAKTILATFDLKPEERERVRSVLAATGIDPVAIAVFALTIGLIVFLFVKYVL